MRVITTFSYLPCLAIWLSTQSSIAQDVEFGIHIQTKMDKLCPRVLTTLGTGEEFCVAEKPIFKSDDFESITPIRTVTMQKFSYFNMIFTKEGFEKIRKLSQELSSCQLILVVNNRCIGVIKNPGEIRNRTLRIDSSTDTEELTWVHDNLKKIFKKISNFRSRILAPTGNSTKTFSYLGANHHELLHPGRSLHDNMAGDFSSDPFFIPDPM